MSLCEQVSHLTSVGILSVPTVRGGGGAPLLVILRLFAHVLPSPKC